MWGRWARAARPSTHSPTCTSASGSRRIRTGTSIHCPSFPTTGRIRRRPRRRPATPFRRFRLRPCPRLPPLPLKRRLHRPRRLLLLRRRRLLPRRRRLLPRRRRSLPRECRLLPLTSRSQPAQPRRAQPPSTRPRFSSLPPTRLVVAARPSNAKLPQRGFTGAPAGASQAPRPCTRRAGCRTAAGRRSVTPGSRPWAAARKPVRGQGNRVRCWTSRRSSARRRASSPSRRR